MGVEVMGRKREWQGGNGWQDDEEDGNEVSVWSMIWSGLKGDPWIKFVGDGDEERGGESGPRIPIPPPRITSPPVPSPPIPGVDKKLNEKLDEDEESESEGEDGGGDIDGLDLLLRFSSDEFWWQSLDLLRDLIRFLDIRVLKHGSLGVINKDRTSKGVVDVVAAASKSDRWNIIALISLLKNIRPDLVLLNLDQ